IPSETPCAEPHAGCCGGWGLETPGYPIIVFKNTDLLFDLYCINMSGFFHWLLLWIVLSIRRIT
ncbi:MAG: hypothetical protein KZQ78_05630, partial [Candidatus Thiodiazotropha sp. (ex Ustalcina ferruginea)]|nr:hypothetical protein [Candidatus Thiodiazotropha sp. (ex Ustalcina ferruginea)]